MVEPLLEISDLHAGYGDTVVLEQVDLSIARGESLSVIGRNGVGKTTLAKALAASLDLQFQRIQCTPDLLPADIFGVSIFNPQESSFRFRPGPVFTNILLVDEINRASPRTQSALLEAMAERQVTIDGQTHPLESPFMVIATQNPIGHRGTFPLPESQLDRFLLQISMEYPDTEHELEILYQESDVRALDQLQPVLSLGEVLQLQQQVHGVTFDRSLGRYLVEIVQLTRNDERIELGCSPRGSIGLFQAARAQALVQGRDFVLPDDIQLVAPLVLRHRMMLRDGETGQPSVRVKQIISEFIQRIDVPV